MKSKNDVIARSNKSCRSFGAVGRKAIVPRVVGEYLGRWPLPKTLKVLDYGAGPLRLHADALEAKLGIKVDAYETGDNVRACHVKKLKDKYDIIYASNVFNTLDYDEAMKAASQIKKNLKRFGQFFVNFPKSPRYHLDDPMFYHVMKAHFGLVVKGPDPFVWMCMK
jgi:hypothetical protein